MAVRDEALAAAKRYMRVEDAEDDATVRECYEAAAAYLEGAGAARTEETEALYLLALHALCLHYYDHRDAVGTEASLPTGLRPVLTQLKLRSFAETEA